MSNYVWGPELQQHAPTTTTPSILQMLQKIEVTHWGQYYNKSVYPPNPCWMVSFPWDTSLPQQKWLKVSADEKENIVKNAPVQAHLSSCYSSILIGSNLWCNTFEPTVQWLTKKRKHGNSPLPPHCHPRCLWSMLWVSVQCLQCGDTPPIMLHHLSPCVHCD